VPHLLRCSDLEEAAASVAVLYGVSSAELEQALALAAHQAQEDPNDPVGSLPSTLATVLQRSPAEPERIHYFHGTRAREPEHFLRDSLWRDVGALVPEISESELRSLRADLTASRIDPHTYSLRATGDPRHHGPCGHLLREMFLHPHDYTSVDYLAGAEIVIDICQAVTQHTRIDATVRYRDATKPCIVEFAVPASHVNRALAAALWHLAAGLRGERTINGNWTYCADGTPLPAKAIVSVLNL